MRDTLEVDVEPVGRLIVGKAGEVAREADRDCNELYGAPIRAMIRS